MLIGLAAMVVAGVSGGAVVALTVASEQNARSEPPPLPGPTLISTGPGRQLTTRTPATALMAVWSSAQWGDVPAILRLQDPVVRTTMGDTIVVGVYQHQRPRMVTLKPRIADVDVRGMTATVRYRLQGDVKASLPQSAILRRHGGSWLLRYDTFIEAAIPYYVIASRAAEKQPSRADRLVGLDATAKYRRQVARLVPAPNTETP